MRDWAWDPGPLGKFVSSEEFRESIDCCIETIEVQEKLVNLSVDLPSYEKNKCDYQQLMNKKADLEEQESASKSEAEIWKEENRGLRPDTFEILLEAIEKLKGFKAKKVAEETLNNVLKGLLFVQEMHLNSSVGPFFEQHQEKYNFLFNRGSSQDQIIFQGSSAEGLTVLRIEEILNVRSYAQLKWMV